MKSTIVLFLWHAASAFVVNHNAQVRHSHLHADTVELTEKSPSNQAGAGPIAVDMNQYNLPLEQIAEEWTAALVPATPMQEEGVYLQAKSSKTIVADSLKVTFPRRLGEGLGIQLLEIAGGREDGLGITVVDGLVEGGCAENSGILKGDAITKIAVFRKTVKGSGGFLEESLEEVSVSTECLGYDATVDAILSLPPQESEEEQFVLTVKRLRRKPTVKVNLQYPPGQEEDDITLELFSGENLRRAFLVRGVKLNDPLARRFDSGGSGDCGAEGTCATCSVNVVSGADLLNPPHTTEKQIFAKNPRWRMSCKAIVGYGMKEGEMTVRVNPKQWQD